MGTDVHLVLVGGTESMLTRARAEIERLEALWSRFRDASDVSIANARAGRPTPVSPETYQLVERAVEGWRVSGGAFDPTLLGAVMSAGYDRSFDRIGRDPSSPSAHSPLRPGCDAIALDPIAGTVTIPPGVGFDPGGIGKGMAADIVAAHVLDAGACGACINLGGDLRVAGASPDDSGWVIGVENPFTGQPPCAVVLDDGAVATSSRLRRRWTKDGRAMHHVINPETLQPAPSDLATVTIVAHAAWWAEIWSKAALVAGPDGFAETCERGGVHGMAFTTGGHTVASASWEALAS